MTDCRRSADQPIGHQRGAGSSRRKASSDRTAGQLRRSIGNMPGSSHISTDIPLPASSRAPIRERDRRALHPCQTWTRSQLRQRIAGPRTLNKTSIKPAVYGEPFVKRHGLFFLIVAPRHGVVTGCVSQDHDRSAVHQLDSYRSGRRAGRGDAGFGAGLVDFRSQRGRSHRRRRRAADAARRSVAAGPPGHGGSIFAQPGRAGRDRAGALARPALDRAAGARTFTASDRRRPRRHRRDRQQRHAMRHRPPHQPAALGLRRDCRSRLGGRSARTDRKRLRRTGAVFLGPHRRTSRPSRRDPGIDAGAGRLARRHPRRADRQALRHAGAIRRRAQLAERRPGRAACERSARALDHEHRGAFARRGHAGPGAAPARHRTIDRRPDPARAVVGQSRAVRFRARRIGRSAAGPRDSAAARPRRRQPAGAPDPRRPSRIRPSPPSAWRSRSATRPAMSIRSAAPRDFAAAWSSAC